jgi:hypothetical protein
VADTIKLDFRRKSILLHAYCEMRGEAFDWERKGDLLSANECWE